MLSYLFLLFVPGDILNKHLDFIPHLAAFIHQVFLLFLSYPFIPSVSTCLFYYLLFTLGHAFVLTSLTSFISSLHPVLLCYFPSCPPVTFSSINKTRLLKLLSLDSTAHCICDKDTCVYEKKAGVKVCISSCTLILFPSVFMLDCECKVSVFITYSLKHRVTLWPNTHILWNVVVSLWVIHHYSKVWGHRQIPS